MVGCSAVLMWVLKVNVWKWTIGNHDTINIQKRPKRKHINIFKKTKKAILGPLSRFQSTAAMHRTEGGALRYKK